jgi:hypothetical protein
MTREAIAYALIGLIIATALPWLGFIHTRRKRERLRRQGIKGHGH